MVVAGCSEGVETVLWCSGRSGVVCDTGWVQEQWAVPSAHVQPSFLTLLVLRLMRDHLYCAKDRITILRGKVEEVELPVDTVDIIISEWMVRRGGKHIQDRAAGAGRMLCVFPGL